MGGTLQVTSTPGEGSQVSLRVPLLSKKRALRKAVKASPHMVGEEENIMEIGA